MKKCIPCVGWSLLFCLALLSCQPSGPTPSKVVYEPVKGFSVETFSFDQVPSDYQDQVEGAGCDAGPTSQESVSYIVNGLVKINGIYEILTETGNNNSWTNQRYENKRWIAYLNIDENGETGNLKIRSKQTDEVWEETVKVFCGT